MTDVNWELLKFKFEILGVPLEDLAAEYKVSNSLMDFQSKNWKQIPLAKKKRLTIRDFETLEEVTEEFKQQVRDETRVMSVIKQNYVGPKYVALEMALLSKALEMVDNLDVKDKLSANAVRTLTTVLEDLLKHNNILNQEKKEDDNSGVPRVWEVHVVEAKPKTENSE